MTPESLNALAELRRGGHFEWYVVNLLAFVTYVYANAARRGEWDKLVLAIGFWAVEFLWEMLNALVLHFSGRAALWTIAKNSVFLIYVGLNLEIAFMFGVAPMILFHLLPRDRALRVLGIPNRLFIPVVFGLFCVGIECILNREGALVWSWPFWRFPHLWLVVLAYCGPFAGLVWIHDHVSLRRKVQGTVAVVAVAAGAHLLLAGVLGWI
jgi:hypothetical protein